MLPIKGRILVSNYIYILQKAEGHQLIEGILVEIWQHLAMTSQVLQKDDFMIV